jgi:hypothetical protein
LDILVRLSDQEVAMGVSFSSPISCAVTPPGRQTTATTQSETFSAPANVTASISADTSGGALKVLSVTSFILQTETEFPDPGELPPGTKPIPVKIEVPVQVATANGVAPLSVATGQYVVVTIQFAPVASTPNTCTATLVINGDAWSPGSVSVPITATVGEITVKVPSIFVVQGDSTPVDITVTLVAGASTTAKLILSADGSADAPNVTAALGSTSLSLTKGKAVPVTLKVSAASTLAAGQYSWSLAVWSYDNTTSFSVSVLITVGVPYYFIKSKLNGNVIDIAGASTTAGAGLDAYTQKTSGNDNQLWNFVPDPGGSGCYYIVSKLNGNVIDIEGDSTKPGALLDAYPKKSGAGNQLWYFVSDPAGSGDCFVVNQQSGNVIDIQNASTAAGALLDAYSVKFTGYTNQLWTVVNGNFPSVADTVNAPGLSLGGGFQNYVLQNGGDALTGVSVTIRITSDFISSANGWSFQLNCNSPAASDVTTQWQQFLIFANAGDNQLTASVQTWYGPSVSDIQNNIKVPLATLPSTTIPAKYSFNIKLNYYSAFPSDGYSDPSSLVSGATFTVTDDTGKTLGTTTITIIGNNLVNTGNPATVANLAAIDTMQLNIGGWENSTRAALTGGAGEITYDAGVPLSAVWGLPSYVHNIGTAESSNVVFGPLPWPFSVAMDDDEPSSSIVQLFEAVSGLPEVEPLEMRKIRAPRTALSTQAKTALA